MTKGVSLTAQLQYWSCEVLKQCVKYDRLIVNLQGLMCTPEGRAMPSVAVRVRLMCHSMSRLGSCAD